MIQTNDPQITRAVLYPYFISHKEIWLKKLVISLTLINLSDTIELKPCKACKFWFFEIFISVPYYVGFWTKWIMTPKGTYFNAVIVFLMFFWSLFDSCSTHCACMAPEMQNSVVLILFSKRKKPQKNLHINDIRWAYQFNRVYKLYHWYHLWDLRPMHRNALIRVHWPKNDSDSIKHIHVWFAVRLGTKTCLFWISRVKCKANFKIDMKMAMAKTFFNLIIF